MNHKPTFGGNDDVKCAPIWEIAARNNKKRLRVVRKSSGDESRFTGC